uniref:Glyco_transf_64 domain-containing protein n=1 Tax=Schistocephalus solidus TaxID=70667 RepID=A0A183TFC9_SCHSO
LRAVNESKYAVFDPLTACIFATSLDFQEASAFSDSELVRMFQSFPCASLRMKQFSLEYVLEIISSLSLDEIDSLQTHVRHFFDSHFSSISKVVFSALDIVNERVFPNFAKCQSAWNDPDFAQTALNSRLRIFPHSNSIRRGFTVVLFTQQHFSNLQFLLSHLSSVSESREIFIVWSNPERDPPPSTYLPNTGKPIRILPSPFYNRKQHTVSKLPETESAALFAINADEGPIPSTADIEFAYEYYLSRYLEELSDKLNFLLTSPLDCVELAIPSVVEHLSERPRLNTLRRYNVDITHRYRNATAGGTERTFIEGLDLASRPTDEHGAAQRKKCYQLVETALRQHSGLPVRSVVSYAQPYRATWQYPRRPDQ